MNINSPALFLKMDVIISNTSYDSSGNLLNFTATNATVVTDNTFGNCTSFNGSSAYLSLAANTIGTALANGSAAFGITAWVSPGSLSSTTNSSGMSNVFFSSADPSLQNNNCIFGINAAGQLQVLLSSNGGTILTFGTNELSVAGWHFIAVTMNGTSLLVQIDSLSYTATLTAGTLTATATDTITIASTVNQDSYFNGSMANVRVYPATLAATDIVAIMNADISNELMFCLPLNESTSSSTPDNSPYEYPAVPVGNPVITPDPQYGTVMSFNGSSQYITLGGLQYTPTIMLTEITVEAWINTSGTAKMILASYDPANYWELAIVPGTVANSLVVSWTTVDENGVAETLNGTVAVNDSQWHFISVVYHAGDGTKSIYVDAVQDISTTAHSGLPLGKSSGISTYGSVAAGMSGGNVSNSNLFSGLMCQFWLYHQALTQQNIQLDMQSGLIAATSYWVDFPLAFSTQQEGQQNTLFIYETAQGQTLLAQFTNTSMQAISFPASASAPTPSDYQLAIVFRPGTLSQETITGITVNESASWNMTVSQLGGLVTLFFNSIGGYNLYPMAELNLTLNNVSADASGGARTTRLQMNYSGLTYADSGAAVQGSTEVVTGIVNHTGQQTSPLAAGFLTTDTVFNGAGNSNALSIRLSNTMSSGEDSQQGIQFNGADTATPTTLILYFSGAASTGDPGILNSYTTIATIIPTVNSSNNGGVSWTITSEMEGPVPYWTLVPSTSFLLASGSALQVDLTNVIASTPSGICNAYIGYQNLPGYWDGEFMLEIKKDNVYSNGTNLGIGTGTPSYPLSINNSGTGIDSPGGTGMNFYVNGSSVPVLQIDASGNLVTGSNTAAMNMTLQNGSLTLGSGNLTLTSGSATLSSGNLTLSAGNLSVHGSATITSGNATLSSSNLYIKSGGSQGIVFQTSQGNTQATISTDSSNNLNIKMPGASGALQVSSSGYFGINTPAIPYAGLAIYCNQQQSLSTVSGGLLIGNPGSTSGNYLALDFENIVSKYGAGQLSIMNLLGTTLTLNATANGINLQSNGNSKLVVNSSGVYFPSGVGVMGLPIMTWQDSQFNFSGQKGKSVSLTNTVTFTSTVITACVMLRSWSLSYTSGDHHLLIETVHPSCGTISGSTVQVNVNAQLADDGNDDSWSGTVHVVVLAMLQTIPTNYPPAT